MPNIEPFEQHTEAYDDWFDQNRFAYRSELGAIRAEMLETGQGVEIGVGTGRFAVQLDIAFGLEPSKRMAAVAKRRGVQVVLGVAEDLPFQDNCFDAVLMVTTLCFLDDIAAAFREVHRVLRNGKRFIVGFVDRDSSLGKEYERRRNKSVFYRYATFYSVGDVVAQLEQAGFFDFRFSQTVFGSLSDICDVQETKPGTGEGAFVTIRSVKSALLPTP
jgi:SAM-dependent methyltransferase